MPLSSQWRGIICLHGFSFLYLRIAKSIHDRIDEYADHILDGKIPAGEFIKLASKRWKNDQKSTEFRFSEEKAREFIQFAERFKHWEGPYLGNPIRLEPQQVFYMGQLFGWLDENGLRRFRQVYRQVARKNGKTIEGSLIGLYCMQDGEGAPQILVTANKEEQAGICVNSAGQLIDGNDLGIRGRNWKAEDEEERHWRLYDVMGRFNRIVNRKTGGIMMTLGKDSSRQDGFNPYVAIVDEYHEAKDDSSLNVLRSGMGSRLQGFLNIITTAGFNKAGVCYKLRDFGNKILHGIVEADDVLPLIYELDPADDWHDPDKWIKSNPNIDVSVHKKYLIGEHKHAVHQGGSAEVGFRTKNLNQWTDSERVWIQDQYIIACNKRRLTLEEFRGRETWVGVDLSKTRDITAVCLVAPTEDGDLDVFWNFYLPEERSRNNSDGVDYVAWAHQGWLTLTPGNIIDHHYIVNDIKTMLEMDINIKNIGYDKYLAESHYTIHGILELGYQMLTPVGQTTGVLSTPTKEVETLALKQYLNFNNPIARWMFSNVVIMQDANSNVKPDKAKSHQKIDGISALVNAMKVYMDDKANRIAYDSQVYAL